jgi:23S rRNA (guanine745-N1)-methyltransferase
MRRVPVTLLCPVRGCGEPLSHGEPGRRDRVASCPRGHSFDRARSGYLNLLQPQDKRSATPGDRAEAAAARRRLYEAGHGRPLLAALGAQLDALELPPLAAVLDVGCGEGSLLGALAASRALEAHGLDLSAAAVEMAARRFPEPTWVIANADRFLPYAGGSFAVVLVLSARLNPAELHRVVAPTGRLLVATPAADDLVQLRAAILGEGVERDRLARAAAELSPGFELEETVEARHLAQLDEAGVRDVLTATYRGARRSQQERLEGLGAMQVTMGFSLGRFRPRP